MSRLDEIDYLVEDLSKSKIDLREFIQNHYEQAVRVEELEKEKQHYKDVASQLVGEEIMNEDGTYQTEMQRIEKGNHRFKQAMEKAIRQLLNNDLPVKKCAAKAYITIHEALKEGEK